VRFGGFGGQRVAAWLLLPRHRPAPLPCIVQYVGYGGGQSAHEWLTWSAMGSPICDGHAGSGQRAPPGVTPDLDPEGSLPHARLLRWPADRRGTTTGGCTPTPCAVEAAASHPDVDASRIVTAGGARAAGLVGSVDPAGGCSRTPAAALVDAPLPLPPGAEPASPRPHRVGVVQQPSRRGRAGLHRDVVRRHGRARPARVAPSLWSVPARPDCPPSTVFAAHNRHGARPICRSGSGTSTRAAPFQSSHRCPGRPHGVDVQRGA
jgi:cephalosporin-C deacetylase